MCQHSTTENDRSWYFFNIQKSRGPHTHTVDKIGDKYVIYRVMGTLICSVTSYKPHTCRNYPILTKKTKVLAQAASAC